MKKNKLLVALLAVICICFSACGDSISCPPETVPTTGVIECDFIPQPVSGLEFTDNFMHLTAGDGNRMISPYSAKMCLALLANGAKGETKEQILEAIGIDDLDLYNEYVKETLARYGTYKGILTLNTANSLWINKSVVGKDAEFLPDYRTRMQDFFSAEVREVTSKSSIEEVNNWAEEKTEGKIDSIFTEEHREFALALANAVYFKAAWDIPFERYLTEKKDFTNIDGSTSKLEFMNSTDSYGYLEADGVKAVKLDYSRTGMTKENESMRVLHADKDCSFSMYFMLSENELDVERFLNENSFENKPVKVSIPKFELEYTVQMNDILMALGMVDAFTDGKADLSGLIGTDNLVVSDVLQKTYIKIDEDGTEAAAVTAIAIVETAMVVPIDPLEFVADRPFYFAIRDNTSGEVLFAGRYESAD